MKPRWPLPALLTALLASCPSMGCSTDDGDDDTTGVSGDDDSSQSSFSEAQVTDIQLSLVEEQPSVVQVTWEQLEPTTAGVEFRFEGDEWDSTPSTEVEAGEQRQVLLGIPFGADVTARVFNDFGSGRLSSDEHEIAAGALPEDLASASVLISAEAEQDPWFRFLLTSFQFKFGGTIDAWTVIVDRQGRLVWARKSPAFRTTRYAQISRDGRTILIDHNSFWGGAFDGGAASHVARMTIDGVALDLYETPGLQHPFFEHGDGSIIWGAADDIEETVERLDSNGNQETLWSCQALLAELGVEGYCASNSMHWHEPDNSVLISLFSVQSVVEVDLDTGSTFRWFGALPGPWTFEPGTAYFAWQHGAHYTTSGTLLVSTTPDAEPLETVVREYELDEDDQALVETWNFGLGDGIYGEYFGEARRLPGGNTLHNYGTTVRVREATPDGEVVWDLEWADTYSIGRMTALNDLYELAQ